MHQRNCYPPRLYSTVLKIRKIERPGNTPITNGLRADAYARARVASSTSRASLLSGFLRYFHCFNFQCVRKPYMMIILCSIKPCHAKFTFISSTLFHRSSNLIGVTHTLKSHERQDTMLVELVLVRKQLTLVIT